MVNKKKISKTAIATTAVATFGAAMTSMYVATEMQADVLDITWNGGNATASNPHFMGYGSANPFDMDQVASLTGTQDFVQWNDSFPSTGAGMDTGRTMSIGPPGSYLASFLEVSSGVVIDPATFSGTGYNGQGGGTQFDGSGTAFIAFREAATGNVGWFQMNFSVDGPIIYSNGQIGSMGESVTVGGSGDCAFELGDVNEDGSVTLLDVTPFVDLLTSSGFLCQADINGDGEVTLLDVQPFVDILTGG